MKGSVQVENGLFIRQLASHCLRPADFDGSDETNGSWTAPTPHDFLHASCDISKRETPVSQSIPVSQHGAPPQAAKGSRASTKGAWCHLPCAGKVSTLGPQQSRC